MSIQGEQFATIKHPGGSHRKKEGGFLLLKNPGDPGCLMSKWAKFGLVNGSDFVLLEYFMKFRKEIG